jgi:GAF domain-containing protein
VLASDDPDKALTYVAAHARDSIGADAVTMCVPGDDPATLRVVAADGIFSAHLGTIAPVAGTIYGEAITTGTPVVITEPAIDPRTVGQPAQHAGAILAVPMTSGGLPPSGVLFLARSVDRGRFDDIDLDLLTIYGNHAALVLQLSAARRANGELRATDDRKQIADDLQDQVIQHLFRLGLDLHAIHARVTDSQAKAMISARIEDTDTIIRHVRDAAFDLRPHEK